MNPNPAEVRARDTLRMFLNDEQRSTYDAGGWFQIHREYGTYRLGPAITTAFCAPLRVRNVPLPQSMFVMPLCVHPRSLRDEDGGYYANIPTADHLLAKKLMIDCKENRFWKSVANGYSLDWARTYWDQHVKMLVETQKLRQQMNERLREEVADNARLQQARMTCEMYGVVTSNPRGVLLDTLRRVFRYPCDS